MKRAVAALVTLVMVAGVLACAGPAAKRPTPEPPPGKSGTPAISPQPTEEKVQLVLYFGDKQAMFLIPEHRVVARKGESLEELLMTELVKGPTDPELVGTIPKETRLLSVKTVDGIAYVNFSRELQTKHWGGSAGELMTVYSIVNTLTELPEIKKVQILLEGDKLDSLAGHMDLVEPLARNTQLIKK